MPNNAQRKLGYRDIVYNVLTGKFYSNKPGDNYEQLNISSGGDGGAGGVGVSTADVTLVNPTTFSNLPDTGGLMTQSDLNTWVYDSLTALDTDGDGDVNLDDYAKLDDGMQKITAAFFQTDNPNSYLYGGGFKGPNVEVTGVLEVGGELKTSNISAYSDNFFINDVAGLTFKGSDPFLYDLHSIRFLSDSDTSNVTGLHYIAFQDSGATRISNVKRIEGQGSDAITLNSPIEGSDATFSGAIDANEFTGDGSKLTGVMPLDLTTLPALS